ncbi:hypothetical protein WA577_003047 [Blastocystis sp. JDR]
MFSQWIQTAKQSASQFLTTAGDVLQTTAHSIKEVADDLTEKTNAYIRDTVKAPEDCTYISSNLIAMGFPGNPKTKHMETKTNNRDLIAAFLQTKYHNHFHIFNLTEEKYDVMLFENAVSDYNFTGFSSPSIGMLFRICIDIEDWLAKSPDNIAVVHCYDGTGRTMTVCAAFLRWAGWFATAKEALDLCLVRRGLPLAAMLPSQLRFLDYFDRLLAGEKLSAAPLRLSRVTVTAVPDLENGACSPFVEVYGGDKLLFASYRKGSRARGVVPPVNAGETVVWKPDVAVRGTVFLRVRHLASVGAPATVLRAQFHTGFVKLFKLQLAAKEVDASVELPVGLTLQLDFMPVQEQVYGEEMRYRQVYGEEMRYRQVYGEEMKDRQEWVCEKELKSSQKEEMSDPLEEQLMNESSPLCNEIELRRNKTKEEGEKELPRTNSVKETITEPQKKEEETTHDEAMDLESMLESYGKDLDLDNADVEPMDADFNLDEYENELEQSMGVKSA